MTTTRSASRTILLPLPKQTRKFLLVLHTLTSVGWFGVTLAMLSLSLLALATGDPATARAAHEADEVLSNLLVLPLGIVALISGVLLGLGSKWGLLRYWWVVVKLVLTVAGLLASMILLRARLHDVVESASDSAAIGLSVALSVASVTYALCTVLSIVKPWGRRTAR